MNILLVLAAALIGITEPLSASPYFRPLNPSHLTPVAGALLAPERLADSRAAGLLPIFTHSPADGCWLPSIVCEDWSPLAVGASVNAGRWTLDAAPLFNVLPWMQRGGLALVPEKWAGVRSVLTPTDGASAVTFSGGPVWEYRQDTNKGYFRIFTGLALHF